MYRRHTLILAWNCVGVAQQYSFRHYGAADGLQNLAILSLAQDGAGYIWAGSEGGLYRYDGTRFRLMAAAEGLPCATEVHALHVAADGALWANTCERIFRFDGQRFHPIAGSERHVVRHAGMANDAHGNVAVATPNGLYEAAPDGAGSYAARPYPLGPELAGTPMRGIARNGSQLWFGCGRRLCVEDRRARFDLRAGGRIAGRCLGRDRHHAGRFRLGPQSEQLYRKPPGAARLVQEKPDIASSIFWGALTVGRDGSVMVPTDKGWRSAARATGGHRRAAGAAHRHDQRGAGRSRGIAVDCADRGRRGPLAGLRRMGSLDQGARPAIRPDLEHPARPERRALGGHLAGPGTAGGPGPPRTWTRKDGLGGDNVRWLGETSDGAMWAVVKPGSVARIDPATGKIRLFGRRTGSPCADFAPRFRRPPGQAVGCDGLRRLSQRPAVGFRSLPPHRSTGVAGARGVGLCGRQTGDHVDHQSRRVVESQRWPVAPVPESRRPAERQPVHPHHRPDGALWLHHRYDAGIERVEFSGDRIVRSTPVLLPMPRRSRSRPFTALTRWGASGGAARTECPSWPAAPGGT
jgi:hypothetical protein